MLIANVEHQTATSCDSCRYVSVTRLLSRQSALLLFLCWFRVIWVYPDGSILQAAVFRAHNTRTVETRVILVTEFTQRI
jgi:hypothetical protein